MQKVIVKNPLLVYPLLMQIQRQIVTNEYSSSAFRLCIFKGKYTKGKNIFTSWVTASSAVAVEINRKDAANILHRLRKEKSYLASLAK